ncbi:MAG: asparagine synthase (glutamine-hydrolyzing) [Bacteroidota bacterium]
MCGICGIIDWNQQLSVEHRQRLVHAMNQAMYHRGPDGTGVFANRQAHLAMRRLSIIDESGGQQPIYNETGEIAIVFNGEIYNFQELREDLLSKGHLFRTQSDTEVLVHLYEDHGVGMLPMLKGMFAFCLYDARNNSYLLARDRFGEKPLYYYQDQLQFSFSSEIKSLLENPGVSRRLNHQALPYYFRTSLVPEPLTLLDQVFSLRPGHFLQIKNGVVHSQAYYEPKYPAKVELNTEEEAIEFIRPHLLKAVHRQRVSDVPIGAFLSGGIDSSTVVALLQKQQSEPLKTFNVRFEHQAYDESAIARKVAKHCGTDHHEIFIPNFDFEERTFWNIIEHVGLPFRDSSAIPTYLISKEIAKYVKVALSGDGGDELFGGYAVFQWYQKILRLQQVARPIRAFADQSLGWMQTWPGLRTSGRVRQIKRGVHTSLEEPEAIPIALNEFFAHQQVVDLMGSGALSDRRLNGRTYELLKSYPQAASNWSALRQIMYYRLKHTLPANMLIKVDRMSMANSLEVRAPFLDPDLFDAAAQLPDKWLIHEGKGKYLIRKIMEKELPAEVFNHPKTGFNMPLFRYQNKVFKQLAKGLLFDQNPWPNLIDASVLKDIYHRGLSTQTSNARQSVFQTAHQLWMMMQLFGWARRFNVQLA